MEKEKMGWSRLERLGRTGAACFVLGILTVPGCASESTAVRKYEPAPFESSVLKDRQQGRTQPHQASSEPERQGPLTLDRAIDEALRASPELAQIQQRVQAATEQVRQAEAGFYPQIGFTEDYNVTNNPVFALMNIINQRRLALTTDFNHPGTQQGFTSQVQAQWQLFEGGGSWFNRKAAASQRRSMEAEWMAARNQLVAKVTETYYKWLQALGFIGVAERALESAETNARLGEARLNAQMALPSEVLRLKTQAAEARSSLVTAQAGARRLEAAMERLLARPILPGEIPSPAQTEPSPSIPPSPEPSDSLIAKALERRPEMESIRSVVRAAKARVRAAQGTLLPKLSFSSQYRWDSESLDDGGESWLVGLQASWPLFQGGMRLAKIREAEAQLREMESKGKQMALDIALEVSQAVLALQEAAEKIRVASEQKDMASRSLEETRRLYQNQVAGVDALLQAEVAQTRADVAYTSAIFEERIAQALLQRALGDFADHMEAS